MNQINHFLLTIALFTLTLSACGYNISGIEDNNNNNVNNGNNTNNINNTNNANNSNNVIPPNYLTREKLYIDLVETIMGLELGDEACEATLTNVENDSQLCRALEKITSIGHIPLGMADGSFRTNDIMMNAEVWSIITSHIGFITYEEICADDLEEESWYAGIGGSLCLKGLLPVDENNLSNPSNNVTVEAWEDFSENLLDYMMKPPTRKHFIEGLLVLLGPFYNMKGDCNSTYEDVENDTFLCHLANFGIDNEILDANQTNFRPDDSFSWTELNKMIVVLTEAGEGQHTGCSGTSIDSWGAGYNDTVCEAGALHSDFSANETPSTIQTMYQAIWLGHSAFLPPVGE